MTTKSKRAPAADSGVQPERNAKPNRNVAPASVATATGATKPPSPVQHATVQRSPATTTPSNVQRCKEAWSKCKTLARQRRILDLVGETIEKLGLIGDHRVSKLVYLVLTSRFLERPVCAVVKGPSSSGKSWAVNRTLLLLPKGATIQLSSMSEKALAYLPGDLKHKTLVVAEAAGLSQGVGAYLLRSLISEGCLRHATVDTSAGLKGVIQEREGPTGLLVTTTKNQLDPELETRLFSIPIDDSAQHTANIMLATAQKAAGGPTEQPPDLEQWHALQEWLELSEHRVVIPFAMALAKAIPPKAVRLRRDFGAVLALTKAHAILHQASRDMDAEGCIIGTLDDYEVVRELVHDLIAEGVEASVPPNVMQTVLAVKRLRPKHQAGVPLPALAAELGLDKSSTSRRVGDAIERGYLRNEQEKQGQPARLFLGEPLPEEVEILPQLKAIPIDRCTVARCTGVELVPQVGGLTAARPSSTECGPPPECAS